jgi:Holliday junction resolvase RusA-like endonuclease
VKINFVILGPPVTKKNSQQIAVNKKTGARFVVQSEKQKKWSKSAKEQLRWQFRVGQFPCAITDPVNVKAIVYRERATGDLLNYLAAVSDALEAAGVIVNDRQVVSVDGSRMDKDAKRPRVEVELEVLECA